MKRAIELFKIELFSWAYFLFYIMPGYYFANKLRGLFIKCFVKNSGKKLIVNREVIFEDLKNISFGNNVKINARCWINGSGTLEIKNNVLIGPNVVIHTANHNFANIQVNIEQQGHTYNAVVIEDNVWIAANVIILPGVRIAQGSVIGAGSVLTKNTEPYSLYAGNPARKLKSLIN